MNAFPPPPTFLGGGMWLFLNFCWTRHVFLSLVGSGASKSPRGPAQPQPPQQQQQKQLRRQRHRQPKQDAYL